MLKSLNELHSLQQTLVLSPLSQHPFCYGYCESTVSRKSVSIWSFHILCHLSVCYPICFQIIPTLITMDKNNDISSAVKGLKVYIALLLNMLKNLGVTYKIRILHTSPLKIHKYLGKALKILLSKFYISPSPA